MHETVTSCDKLSKIDKYVTHTLQMKYTDG